MPNLPERPRRLRLIPETEWKPIESFRGRANTRLGVAMVQVMNQGLKDGRYQDQYDQPVLVESTGAVVIVVDSRQRVGFVQNYRLTGPRCRVKDGSSYVRDLLETHQMPALIESLGQMSWELPAGLVSGDVDAGDLRSFILKLARTEAAEEGGFEIEDDITILPPVNFNPTFFAHAQHVVIARLAGTGPNRPEARETIGKIRLFTRAEIDQAVRDGVFEDAVFEDGKTLSALRRAGL